MAKGGGSANKSLLFQETRALLSPAKLSAWLDEKLRTLGTAACPPYHLALVIGGTSAEMALKTAKYASARYLDTLPTSGSELGHGFRDVELEAEVLALTQQFGIGAQFGGKYFCHDVRVIRLPRHGASCPVALAVSCSADRQVLARISRRRRLPRAARARPGPVPPRDHRRPPRRRRRPDRPEPAHGRDPGRAVEAPGEDPPLAHAGRWSWPATSPTPRSPSGSTPASRCPSTSATTASTTPARPRRPRGTHRARSGPPPRAGWTPTSSASRPPAGRW